MEAIQGGFKEGSWQSDRDAFSDEYIETWDDRLKQLSRYPQVSWLKDYIWGTKPKPELRIVK